MIDFIVNPTAGGKDGKKIKKALPKLEKKACRTWHRVRYTYDKTAFTSTNAN